MNATGLNEVRETWPASLYPDERELQLDVRGLDYESRRRQLFEAVRALRSGDQLRVISTAVRDLYWLRYEIEGRDPRYGWSQREGSRGVPAQTVVRRSW
jgi:uncharacterized protein (DUF2249 family)